MPPVFLKEKFVSVKKQEEVKTNNLEAVLATDKKSNTAKKVDKKPMVDGIFRNWEIRGAPVIFSFSNSKAPASKFTLEDGKRYTLPLEVAKHINKCTYPVSKAKMDKDGKYIGKENEIVRRYSFRRIDDLIDDVD